MYVKYEDNSNLSGYRPLYKVVKAIFKMADSVIIRELPVIIGIIYTPIA